VSEASYGGTTAGTDRSAILLDLYHERTPPSDSHEVHRARALEDRGHKGSLTYQLREIVGTYGVGTSIRLCGRSSRTLPGGKTTPWLCRNRWACPSCSPYYLGKDFLRIAKVLHAYPGVLHATLTVGQPAGASAKESLENLRRVWGFAFTRGSWFTDFRRTTGMLGYARAIEWTFPENGYHPHSHVALVFDKVPERDVSDRLLEHHVSTANRLGLAASVSAQSARIVPPGAGRESVAFYLTEQNAIRQSRPGKGRTPGDLVHSILESRDDDDISRLQEFHLAIKGCRKISTSNRFWNPL